MKNSQPQQHNNHNNHNNTPTMSYCTDCGVPMNFWKSIWNKEPKCSKCVCSWNYFKIEEDSIKRVSKVITELYLGQFRDSHYNNDFLSILFNNLEEEEEKEMSKDLQFETAMLDNPPPANLIYDIIRSEQCRSLIAKTKIKYMKITLLKLRQALEIAIINGEQIAMSSSFLNDHLENHDDEEPSIVNDNLIKMKEKTESVVSMSTFIFPSETCCVCKESNNRLFTECMHTICESCLPRLDKCPICKSHLDCTKIKKLST